MALTIQDASVNVFRHNLKQLSHLLDKAARHAAATGIEPVSLLQARLADDMLPLTFQVQAGSDAAKLAIARLTGTPPPTDPDTETTIEQLQARIEKTRAYLNSFGAEAFAGAEERAVNFKAGPNQLSFNGQQYLLHFALPNFFFHVTTAYAILRKQGVPLGKADFLGRA